VAIPADLNKAATKRDQARILDWLHVHPPAPSLGSVSERGFDERYKCSRLSRCLRIQLSATGKKSGPILLEKSHYRV
jgi:hypothetical protein